MRYNSGLGAVFLIFIIVIVLAVGGFFFYRGALNQEYGLESEIPPPLPAPLAPEVNREPLVEIGAEDEMVEVPEGNEGTGSTLPSASAKESVIDARALKEFAVTAKNFSFSETEIRVKKGDFVRINFKSADGFHDWVVDAFDAKTNRVATGGSTSIDFVADKAGTFEFYCSVGNHRQMGMVGKLIVE